MQPPQEDPFPEQANPRPCGRSSGVPNYCNDLIIDIVKQLLPQGIEAWRNVALLYQNTSNKRDLCRRGGIHDNWVRKLCNNFKKPTGKPGDNLGQIFCCLEIEHRIQRKANAAILGAISGELDHGNDQGHRESEDFSIGSGYDKNPEVAAATAKNDDGNLLVDELANNEEVEVMDAATVHPNNADRVHHQSLPTFIGGPPSGNVATMSVVLAMTSVSRRGGGQGKRVRGQDGGRVDIPRRSPSSFDSSRGGGGG